MPFAFHCLRHRLGEMLPRALGGHLVDQLDETLINKVVDEVQVLAIKAQAVEIGIQRQGQGPVGNRLDELGHGHFITR